MKASLEEMLKSHVEKSSNKSKEEDVMRSVRSNSSRHKVAASESALMKAVVQHPVFMADPFAALEKHLQQTIVAANSNDLKR